MSQELLSQASGHIGTILRESILHTPEHRALVVYDEQSVLSRLLAQAYREALPEATFIHFDAVKPGEIFTAIELLKPKDLVVLVQSNSFRLNEFRIRIELFKRDLKTIEHLHLERMSPDQHQIYVDALAYDSAYYHAHGLALKKKLDSAKRAVVECAGTKLVYESEMEAAKLNIGDYTGMKNIGGTFPIGEVFTEPKDLTAVNGEAMIFAFAGMDHMIQVHEPFKVSIKKGVLTASDAPKAFLEILDLIRADEEVMIREFGLGLNPAMHKGRIVNDITAFERQKGLHFSLGAKHGVYKKPGLEPKKTRYHIDVFIDVHRILLDGEPLFEYGEYLLKDHR